VLFNDENLAVSLCCDAPIFWEMQGEPPHYWSDAAAALPVCEICGLKQNEGNK